MTHIIVILYWIICGGKTTQGKLIKCPFTLKIKLSVIFPEKWVDLEKAENFNLGQASYTKTIYKSTEQRTLFCRGKGVRAVRRALVNKKPIGVTWEFETEWYFGGWVGTVSHWLYCLGRRKPAFFPKLVCAHQVPLLLLGLPWTRSGRVLELPLLASLFHFKWGYL